ncbi:hypothetical protein E8E14_003972 [Neopestalotiopsis sp. 37M]|nr:hypothetical protein E8E14_003972 [Neopestalotiopsis sp. 37M]
MPFLRRRGVMASENDMRRHTFIDPDPPSQSGLAPFKPKASAPRKSLGNDLLDPNAAANGHGRTSVDSQTAAKGAADPLNGERSRTDDPNNDENNSFESNMPSLSTSMSLGRPSEDPFDRPESPPIQEETPKHRRFSMLRFRNASDSQLSVRMRQQQLAEKPPPLPTQTPTIDSSKSPKKSRMKLPIKIRRSGELPRPSQDGGHLGVGLGKKDRRKSMAGVVEEVLQERNKQNVSFQDGRPRPYSSKSHPGPRHNDQANSALSLPANRLSESERSEASSGEHSGGFGNTAPAANASSTSSSIFRLGRRKQKQPEPMFPLAHLPQQRKNSTLTPTISNNSMSNVPATSAQRPSTGNGRYTPVASPSFGPSSRAPGSPATALFRPGSRNSGQGSPTRAQLGLRERSSTMSSLGRNSEDHQFPGTARTSTSIGRKSFGDLLGLGRLRNNPDLGRPGTLTPATPGSLASKNNSLQLPREKESVVLPERREDESAAKYLARLEDVLSRGVIAAALSKGSDPWSASVLRSYMRTFGFFEQPMDMAIRKLLMEAELPKETQQIDRCLQAFANRYHECNPGIYSSPDQAYFVAFSLLILHTDVFNRNNKYKMQKADYLKNTRGEGIFDDVLECFYDNITYTPFIHVEDDFDINGDPVAGSRTKKKVMFPNGATEAPKRTKDPIDPYTLILDGKLDTLRPPLKEQMPLEEHYNYIGTAKELNIKELQKTFFKTGVLQIVSARSRPDAFMTEKTLSNPQEAEPGIVDIKVTKVGTLWRKDAKKKKTRSPWQEWGAILTGAQLYFFRNTAWVKSLVHQYDTHVKSGNDGIPLIFKPPLESFKPDALMSTEGAVALFDQSYKKHKNAFVYVRHGGFEEVLLAHDEDDRNDWLAKLNYAAAFRTSGVRMRGVVGGNLEGQGRRAIRRLDSSEVTQVIQTPTGEVSINRSRIDHQMAHDILAARRFMMSERIAEGEDKLQAAQRQLDDQLRNARHLLLLAPIQEKTREQVRTGAAKLIAQLRWSRTEIWRLKCHMDILLLDLEEDKHINGDLEDSEHEPSVASDGPSLKHKESLASSHKTTQQSPRAPAPLSLALSSGNITQTDGESPMTEVFQTPPTSATTPIFPKPQTSLGSMRPQSETTKPRKASVSSAASSAIATMSPPRQISSPGSDPEMTPYDELNEEDANERQVLEQAGLLDAQISRTSDRPGSSKGEDTPERHKRSSISASDKDKSERSKIRRSLQRTLRESTGHLAHHRSKKGHDSASSGVIADDMARDDVLTRGTGSFTLHGKKASVVNFGSDLQGMTSNEHIRQRKQPLTEELVTSPLSADDDDAGSLHGAMSLMKERRESAASASTATARSFRELHRKYSSAQNAHRVATGGLVVPSDDDSDAAISFSDGRRTPLPPVEDGSGDEDDLSARRARAQSKQSVYFTPEPPSSPVEEVSEDEDEDGGATQHTHEHERFSPPTQSVSA